MVVFVLDIFKFFFFFNVASEGGPNSQGKGLYMNVVFSYRFVQTTLLIICICTNVGMQWFYQCGTKINGFPFVEVAT